jgi:hypothetical protein
MKKRYLLIALLALYCYYSNAQEAERKQEFQASLDIMDGIKNANLYYKLAFKSNPTKYYRARLGRFKDYYTDKQRNLFLDAGRYSIAFGYEYRMPLIRQSKLILGIEPFGNYQRYSEYSNKLRPAKAGSSFWEAGVGFPLGILFNSNSNWFVGVETIPSFYYQATNRDDFKILEAGQNSLNFGFYSLALCFGYRIPTKRI